MSRAGADRRFGRSAPPVAGGGQSLRVLFAGGGTGGHLYIGIALARELRRRDDAFDCLFVGTRNGLESRILPREGFRLECIESAGLKGMGKAALVRNLLLIPRSLVQSRRLVRSYRPDVAVGVGGYASGPVILAAWWLGRPTLIVEPNAFPGLANRLLSRVVDRVALALSDTGGYFRDKAVLTGIPVREEFERIPRREHAPGMLSLLVYGGSQGSHALNEIVRRSLPELGRLGPSLTITHQTGERELEEVRRAYREAGVEGDVRPFLEKIFDDLSRADLVLSRAGAGTVAELSVAGRAAILVPFPGAADDHQTRNAQALEKIGAAKMIREEEWGPGRLLAELRHFMDRPGELRRMEDAARKAAKPGAAGHISDLIEDLARTESARGRTRSSGNN